MSVIAVLTIIFAHYFGDWLLQSREMALKKSSDIYVLLEHLSMLFLPLFIASFVVFEINPITEVPTAIFTFQIVGWLFINLICHGIQDWFIWKIAGKHLMQFCKTKEEAYNSKMFWDIVGLDGMLHYFIYFISYYLLSKLA